MKERESKRPAWRTVLVLALTVLMAAAFMPAGTPVFAEDGGGQETAQSVDKTSPASSENGSVAADQRTGEKQDGQAAQDAVTPGQNGGNTAESDDQKEKDDSKAGYTKIYLNGKDGKDNADHQGIGRGLDADKPVQTFAEAKRVYYAARDEGYKNISEIEIDGTVTVDDSESWDSADPAAAENKTDDAEAGDIYLLADLAFGEHSGSPDFNISASMRGGSPYHWKDDHNDEVPLNKLSSDMRKLNQGISESLNLHTEENPGDAVENSAPVKIYGNRSETRGGGIGSNGNVSEGTKSTTQVTARKKWDDKSSDKKRPDSIQVQLFRSTKSDLSDKQYMGYITLTPDEDGKWTNQAEFKNLPEKDAAGNEYIYTVGEKKIDGYDATVTQDDKTKEFTITNKPSQTPPAPTPTPTPSCRHVTVQKVWKLDDGRKRPDSVLVQLMKNGTAYGQPVTLNDADHWTFTWDRLADDGSQWSVQEVIVPDGFTASQQTAAETQGSKVTITNDDNPVKPNKPVKPDKPKTPSKHNSHKTAKPKTPSKTNKTVKPNTPVSPVSPKTPAVHHSTVHNTTSTPASSATEPRTSDETRLGTELIVFGGAAALLALALALKKRKN